MELCRYEITQQGNLQACINLTTWALVPPINAPKELIFTCPLFHDTSSGINTAFAACLQLRCYLPRMNGAAGFCRRPPLCSVWMGLSTLLCEGKRLLFASILLCPADRRIMKLFMCTLLQKVKSLSLSDITGPLFFLLLLFYSHSLLSCHINFVQFHAGLMLKKEKAFKESELMCRGYLKK